MLAARRRSAEEPLTEEERTALANWHGWGAAPQVFDRPEFTAERERLRLLLGPLGYDAAARTTLNAFFTAPELVRAMWSAVERLGVNSGVALEPGCGRGSFLSLAPERFVGVGIELDPTTAEVASHLVADRHRIVAADFAKTRIRRGSVDVVIGNVPFGRYGVFDPEFNAANRLAIHDHFIVKSLAALAPGGIAVLLSSRYSLDKADPTARRAMGEQADFLGALRLPSVTHQATAGTRVVTDVLLFRGRADGAPSAHANGFLDPPIAVVGGDGLRSSAYFAAHPEQVLGEARVTSGQFGPELDIDGERVAPEVLDAAFGRVAAVVPPASAPEGSRDLDNVLVSESIVFAPVGRLERTAFGFRRFGPDGWEHHDPGRQGAELASLLELRDLARSLVELENVSEAESAPVEARRGELASRYRRYVTKYGPLNRARMNAETGRRSVPRLGGFRTDPDWPRVAALERYDESSGHAAPATLLQRRVVVPRTPKERAENPDDALSISLAERGRVDLAFVADLLSIPEAHCLEILGDRVYVDPGDHRVVIAAEYCSGNVRQKLARAGRGSDGHLLRAQRRRARRSAPPRRDCR